MHAAAMSNVATRGTDTWAGPIASAAPAAIANATLSIETAFGVMPRCASDRARATDQTASLVASDLRGVISKRVSVGTLVLMTCHRLVSPTPGASGSPTGGVLVASSVKRPERMKALTWGQTSGKRRYMSSWLNGMNAQSS